MDQSEPLRNWLTQETGWQYQVAVAPSYVAVIESLGSNRTDFAFLSTFAFLIAEERFQSEAILTITNRGQTTYKSQIIARADGPKSIKELNGKTFAYVDPLSSSGYILPASLFLERNIKLKDFVFAGRHDSAVTMVYQGKVDAAATYYIPPEENQPKDARSLIKTQYPDVFKKVVIIELTGELPNEAVVARHDLTSEMKTKVKVALLKWVSTPSGKTTLKALYNGDGFKPVDPAPYVAARKMLKTLGKKPEDLLKK